MTSKPGNPAFDVLDGSRTPPLIGLTGLTREDFSKRFRDSPVKRAKHPGFLRNVAVALGRRGARETLLRRRPLKPDPEVVAGIDAARGPA